MILAKTSSPLQPCERHEVQQGHMQDPVPGSRQSQAQIQTEWRMD